MHVIGSANSLSDLVNAIFNACTDNGWTLSTDVLHKGDVHVRIREVSGTVEFLGGTGIDGSDALTGAGPAVVRIRPFAEAFSFPMTYEVHIFEDPDEVFVVVNYNSAFYQWAWWGQSSVEGLPGTGVYYTATQHIGSSTEIGVDPEGWTLSGRQSCVPFGPYFNNGSGSSNNGYLHHGLDSEDWNAATISGSSQRTLHTLVTSLLKFLPNQWNNETVLLPISVWWPRTTNNKISLVADLQNARWCRIDYHDPGDIITIGGDSWKLYPFYRKDATARDGGGSTGGAVQHTGTLGFAIRYTGD